MTDVIMNILQWAIPSGGIGAAIAWIANRKVKEAEQAKQIHDTFKEMYGDVSKELLAKQKELNDAAEEYARAIEDLNKENAKTRYALNRLSRALEAIQLCPHRASCPVSGELQNQEDGDANPADGANGARRKPRQQRKPRHDPDEKPDGREPDGDAGVGADVARATPGQRRLSHRGKGDEKREGNSEEREP